MPSSSSSVTLTRKRPAASAKEGQQRRRKFADEAKAPLHTLIINLKKRPDRWAKITDRLDDLGLQGKLNIERLDAVDGAAEGFKINPKEVTSTWTTDRNAKYDGRAGYRRGVELPLSPGELGCMLSHLAAWRRVLELADAAKANAAATTAEVAGSRVDENQDRAGKGEKDGADNEVLKTPAEEPVLILEDDARPTKVFLKQMRKAIDDSKQDGADILYLGYIQGAPWRRTVRKGLHEAEYLWTTVGYVIWPRGARKLLDALPIDCPVDNWMAWQAVSRRVKSLAIDPEIVEQEEEWDVGSDVRHSDDAVLDGEV